MGHHFTFYKGRANVEKIRINVNDPLYGNRVEDSMSLPKVKLRIGTVAISTETGEITWNDTEETTISIREVTTIDPR